MLGASSKLLGRGFLLGFLLPSILFCAFVQAVDLNQPVALTSSAQITPFVLVALIVAIILVALNRSIVRFLEGYGTYNPLLIFKHHKLKQFRMINALYEEADILEEKRKINPQTPPTIPNFARKLEKAVMAFPDREDRVLATKFGNTMRAFEVYSLIVYDMEAIALWPRLYGVIPKAAQDRVSDTRAIIDFNANTLILSCFCILITITKFILKNYFFSDISSMLVILIPVITGIYSWIALPQSAQQWGDVIKSTFDLYRARLAKELGLAMPDTIQAEREMWREVSRTILFRRRSAASNLDTYRLKSKPKGQKPTSK